MFGSRKSDCPFSIEIPKAALESIFDDCDQFDADETGGRLIGTYHPNGDSILIKVAGVLPAGPNAQRSPTFFQQDGNYQEQLFRAIEQAHPEVEHLGNWHTHHVNGLQALSGGDKETYGKTVNHAKHNTDLFYALLVTTRNARGSPRHDVKHFVFRRGDPNFYEVPRKNVRTTNVQLLAPALSPVPRKAENPRTHGPNPERVRDQQFFEEFYPDIKPLMSRSNGAPYWKGSFPLIDGSLTTVVAMEEATEEGFSYSIAVSCQHPAAIDIPAAFNGERFSNARRGVLQLERELNRVIFRGK